MKRKILIIRFSSIGDLILITPIVRCLKMQLDAEIHLITKTGFKSVLVSNPYIDKHWSFDKSILECLDELKSESFDLVIDLHKNTRSFLLRILLRKPTYSFNKINFWKWIMCAFKINLMPDKHLVDRYFEGLRALHVKNDGKGLDYFFSKNINQEAIIDGLPPKFIVGVLGAAHFTKQIPLEKWRELMGSVKFPIVLIGGKNELLSGKQLELEFPGRFINCAGQFSIDQSAKIIESAMMVITPDTGMMHIAAALKKPMHVFWGNTIPQFGMSPYYGTKPGIHRNHEVLNLACRPCSKLGYPKCPKNHFNCMMQQQITPILLDLEM